MLFLGYAWAPLFSVAQTFSEILGRPENTSISVNVIFSQVVQVYFEYGTVKGNYPFSTQPVTSNSNEPVEVRLSGLLPDTRYWYRTRYRLPGEPAYKEGEEHREFIIVLNPFT